MSETKMVSVPIPQPPVPDGFEHTNEYRIVRKDDWLLGTDSKAWRATYDWGVYRWILRPIPTAPTPREVFAREYREPFDGCPMPEGYGAAMEDGEPVMCCCAEMPEGQPWLTASGCVFIGPLPDGRMFPRLLLREKAEPTLEELVTEHEKNLRSTGIDYDEHGAICKILRKIAADLEGSRAK